MQDLIRKTAHELALHCVYIHNSLFGKPEAHGFCELLLHNGTHVGDLICEAMALMPVDRPIAFQKLKFALAETAETAYWLGILCSLDLIPYDIYRALEGKCTKLRLILTLIIKLDDIAYCSDG